MNKQEENELLFWKVYRNIFLNKLIFENLNQSEIFIDSVNIKYVPEIPKLNNIKFSTSSGYCNWLIKNLIFNDQSGEESNNQLKKIIKKEGLDKFNFLSKFKIDSIVIDNHIEEEPRNKEEEMEEYDSNGENQSNGWVSNQYIKELELSENSNITISKDDISKLTKKLRLKKIIPLSNIPSSVQSLKVEQFTDDLSQDKFPITIEQLNLGEYFNQPISCGQIPSNISQLNLGWRFSQNLKNVYIPSNIKYLIVGESYNVPFKNDSLPNTLEILELGSNFSEFKTLVNLPESIHTLIFGDNFNRPIEPSFKLPNSIKKLVFGNLFNHEIPNGCLENNGNLETLIFGIKFNKPLTIENVPSSIKNLEISNSAQNNISEDIFNKYFSLDAYMNKLNGDHLEIGDAFKKFYLDKYQKIVIPKSIKSLTLNNDSFLKNHNIPRHIKYLSFGIDFINTDYLDQQQQENPQLDGANIPNIPVVPNPSIIEKRYFIKSRDIPKNTTHLSIQSQNVVIDFLPSHITHFKTPKNYCNQINILKNNNNLKSIKTKLLNINYIIHDELKPFTK